MNRKAYGFEIKKNFFKDAEIWINNTKQKQKDLGEFGYCKSELEKEQPVLF